MDNPSLRNHNTHLSDSLTHAVQHLVPLTQKLQELAHLLLEHYEPSSLNTCTTEAAVDTSVRTRYQEHLYEDAGG